MEGNPSLDWEYIANAFGALCGLPVRLYEKGEMYFRSPSFCSPKDPIVLHEKEILESQDPLGYLIDDDFFYYAYFSLGSRHFIVGPGRSLIPDDRLIAKLGLELEVGKEEEEAFRLFLRTLIPMPLESLLEALSMTYYAFSGIKVNSRGVLLQKKGPSSPTLESEVLSQEIDAPAAIEPNNSILVEQQLCEFIEKGRIDALNAWLSVAPPTRPGKMSQEAQRQLRYTFIASATVESRAAIRGHMDVQEALALSDLYIQKMEVLQNEGDIYALMKDMAVHYAEEVAKIRGKEDSSPFLRELNVYLNQHLSSPIKAEEISHSLYVSRSVLFARVKKETGLSLHDYVLRFKIEEAKRLLRQTEKSLGAIALYLGFSSPSHFNRVFKEKVGTMPSDYRKKHQK